MVGRASRAAVAGPASERLSWLGAGSIAARHDPVGLGAVRGCAPERGAWMGACGNLVFHAVGPRLGAVCAPAAVGQSGMARLAASGQALTAGLLAAIGPMQCAVGQPMGARRFDQLLCAASLGATGPDGAGCRCWVGTRSIDPPTLAWAMAAAAAEAPGKSAALGKRGKGSLGRSAARRSARS